MGVFVKKGVYFFFLLVVFIRSGVSADPCVEIRLALLPGEGAETPTEAVVDSLYRGFSELSAVSVIDKKSIETIVSRHVLNKVNGLASDLIGEIKRETKADLIVQIEQFKGQNTRLKLDARGEDNSRACLIKLLDPSSRAVFASKFYSPVTIFNDPDVVATDLEPTIGKFRRGNDICYISLSHVQNEETGTYLDQTAKAMEILLINQIAGSSRAVVLDASGLAATAKRMSEEEISVFTVTVGIARSAESKNLRATVNMKNMGNGETKTFEETDPAVDKIVEKIADGVLTRISGAKAAGGLSNREKADFFRKQARLAYASQQAPDRAIALMAASLLLEPLNEVRKELAACIAGKARTIRKSLETAKQLPYVQKIALERELISLLIHRDRLLADYISNAAQPTPSSVQAFAYRTDFGNLEHEGLKKRHPEIFGEYVSGTKKAVEGYVKWAADEGTGLEWFIIRRYVGSLNKLQMERSEKLVVYMDVIEKSLPKKGEKLLYNENFGNNFQERMRTLRHALEAVVNLDEDTSVQSAARLLEHEEAYVRFNVLACIGAKTKNPAKLLDACNVLKNEIGLDHWCWLYGGISVSWPLFEACQKVPDGLAVKKIYEAALYPLIEKRAGAQLAMLKDVQRSYYQLAGNDVSQKIAATVAGILQEAQRHECENVNRQIRDVADWLARNYAHDDGGESLTDSATPTPGLKVKLISDDKDCRQYHCFDSGKFYYVKKIEQRAGSKYVLISLDVETGEKTTCSEILIQPPDETPQKKRGILGQNMLERKNAVFMSGRVYATLNEGLGIFPVSEKKARIITPAQGLPSTNIRAITAFDGRLYMSAGLNIYLRLRDKCGLISFDPEKETFEMMCSTARLNSKNQLDGLPVYMVRAIVGDKKRKCLWFDVLERDVPNGTSSRSGVWQYSFEAEKFRKVWSHDTYPGNAWNIKMLGDKLLLSFGGGACTYDPDKEEFETYTVFERRLKEVPGGKTAYQLIKSAEDNDVINCVWPIKNGLLVGAQGLIVCLQKNGDATIANHFTELSLPKITVGIERPVGPGPVREMYDTGKNVLVVALEGLFSISKDDGGAK